MSHGEDIPLGDSQKAKEPNKIKEGGGVKPGDTFSLQTFKAPQRDTKTTRQQPLGSHLCSL